LSKSPRNPSVQCSHFHIAEHTLAVDCTKTWHAVSLRATPHSAVSDNSESWRREIRALNTCEGIAVFETDLFNPSSPFSRQNLIGFIVSADSRGFIKNFPSTCMQACLCPATSNRLYPTPSIKFLKFSRAPEFIPLISFEIGNIIFQSSFFMQSSIHGNRLVFENLRPPFFQQNLEKHRELT